MAASYARRTALVYMEMWGRHNAIDKIAGYMALHDIGPKAKFSHRRQIDFEMVIKTVQMGIPVWSLDPDLRPGVLNSPAKRTSHWLDARGASGSWRWPANIALSMTLIWRSSRNPRGKSGRS